MEIHQSSSQVETVPKLLEIDQLFKKTVQVFRERIWVFIGIAVIPILVSIIFVILSVFSIALLKVLFLSSNGSRFVLILSFLISLFVIAIIYLWPYLAILYAVKERERRIGVKDALKKTWSKIISLYWIILLTSVITGIGFLLLIIPGIIFGVWFSLAIPVLIGENLKGVKALRRSKELVGKNWWPVFFRLVFMVLISLVINFLVNSILFKITYGEIFGYILIILWFIFSLIFIFLLYENLKELEGKEAKEVKEAKENISQQSYA